MHVDPCGNTMTVSERRFLEGVGFGLIGTLAMSVVMLIVYVTGQSLMEEPAPLSFAARLVAAIFRLPSITAWAVIGGVVLHLAYGAFWFGLVAVSTSRITWRKGLAVGLGLWLLMGVHRAVRRNVRVQRGDKLEAMGVHAHRACGLRGRRRSCRRAIHAAPRSPRRVSMSVEPEVV